MPLKTSDRIAYPSRANYRATWDGLAALNLPRNDAVAQFLGALDEACEEAGIDFAIAAAHVCNETDWLRDTDFTRDRNPAGIGHPDNASGGIVFPSFRAGARFYVGELCLKLRRSTDWYVRGADTIFTPDMFAKWNDVRAMVDGALGTFPRVERIHDLNARFGPNNREAVWMTDPNGPAAIVAKGRALFPDLPDQNGGTAVPTGLTIDVDLVGRHDGPLRDRDAWITVHNTGSGSSRAQERGFVASGGGAQGVMYHFAVDETGVTQIMPLDKRGVHAGNAEGNATSIAIEMCMNREPWATIKEHTARLLAAIVSRDPRLVFGTGTYRYSLDRVREHRDWPGANPNCPQRLIATDGGVERIVARAREIAGGTVTPPKYARAHPPRLPAVAHVAVDEADGSASVWLPLAQKRWTALASAPRHEWADEDSALVGPPIKAGAKATFEYSLASADGTVWFVSKGGSRCPATAFVPRG
jgi:hypothetical protein